MVLVCQSKYIDVDIDDGVLTDNDYGSMWSRFFTQTGSKSCIFDYYCDIETEYCRGGRGWVLLLFQLFYDMYINIVK
jgi:hypothetical protein